MGKTGAERSPFSQVHHVGIVVRDIDQAVEYYSSLGIGPFVPAEKELTIVERKAYGKPADDIRNISKFAQIGPVQFVLTQPVGGKTPNMEFLESRGEGVSHLAFYVDDIDKEVAKLVKKGVEVINSGKFLEGGGFAYFVPENDTDKFRVPFLELIQYPSQSLDKAK